MIFQGYLMEGLCVQQKIFIRNFPKPLKICPFDWLYYEGILSGARKFLEYPLSFALPKPLIMRGLADSERLLSGILRKPPDERRRYPFISEDIFEEEQN